MEELYIVSKTRPGVDCGSGSEILIAKFRLKWIKKMRNMYTMVYSVQFSSIAQLGLTLCDPVDCSMPGFPVHHQLPVLAQIHVHCVSDAIQPSHSLSSPSPSAFNLSQHQGPFQ